MFNSSGIQCQMPTHKDYSHVEKIATNVSQENLPGVCSMAYEILLLHIF